MNALAADLWGRAKKALVVAKMALSFDPDSAASRAYYSAFYAVSARFALDDASFGKHSAVEAAVHRDLVKKGVWPVELGQGYSRLAEVRSIGDYGEMEHVSDQRAAEAVQLAESILCAIAEERVHEFPFP